MRGQQDGVVVRGVQRAIRAVYDAGFRQYDAGLGLEVMDDELVLLRVGGLGRSLGYGGGREYG